MNKSTISPEALRLELARDPSKSGAIIDALLKQAGVAMPADYDIETALTDVFCLGILVENIQARPSIHRLAVWISRRLPEPPFDVRVLEQLEHLTPHGYAVETAFADVLCIAAVAGPGADASVARLAVWLSRRIGVASQGGVTP